MQIIKKLDKLNEICIDEIILCLAFGVLCKAYLVMVVDCQSVEYPGFDYVNFALI